MESLGGCGERGMGAVRGGGVTPFDVALKMRDPEFRQRLIRAGWCSGMAIACAGELDSVAEVMEERLDDQPEFIMAWVVGGEIHLAYVRRETNPE